MGRIVKGYKATEKDMTCRGMRYEIGVTYRAKGRVELCKNGFHFCRRLVDVFDYYPRGECRVFEVVAEEVQTDGKKSVAFKITLTRELSGVEVNRGIYGRGDGNSYNYCTGDGYSNGNGRGKGCGYGYGYGYGYGSGYGYHDGAGYGKNIQRILKMEEF